MARRKKENLTPEEQLERIEQELEEYGEKIKELRQQKKELEKQIAEKEKEELYKAVVKSGKSIQEIMDYLS